MNGFEGNDPRARQGAGRVRKLVPALIAAFMIVAGVAMAANGGVLNGSFEQGDGNSLDDWTLKAYHYEESGLRDQVYGPESAEPVPCDQGDPYGICVVEGDDLFETYDFGTEEFTEHRVPVLDGEKMVRLGGTYQHRGFAQDTDGLAVEQIFTVDAANPVVNLNYYLSSFDYPGYDEASLMAMVHSPGTPLAAWRLDVGSGELEGYKGTGWQSSNLDLSRYAGEVVTLEIQMKTDGSLPSWAYIDAGTAPASPVDTAGITATGTTNDPSGRPISIERALSGGSGKVHFLLRGTQADRFEDGCPPVTFTVPVEPGSESISELGVMTGRTRTEATEVSPDLWRAEVECVRTDYLAIDFQTDAEGGDRETRAFNVGDVTVSDPLGIVYDAEAHQAALSSGKTDQQAKEASKIAGATVTLQSEGAGGFADVAEDDPRTLPSTPMQISAADGGYQWLLGSGDYRVSVTKGGYQPAYSATFDRNTQGGVDVALTKVKGPIVDPPIIDPPDEPVPPVPACSKLSGNGKVHCQRVENCKKLSGKKRAACLKLVKRRKPCLALKGKRKGACEKKAKALTKCDKLKGKKKKKCVARAKRIK